MSTTQSKQCVAHIFFQGRTRLKYELWIACLSPTNLSGDHMQIYQWHFLTVISRATHGYLWSLLSIYGLGWCISRSSHGYLTLMYLETSTPDHLCIVRYTMQKLCAGYHFTSLFRSVNKPLLQSGRREASMSSFWYSGGASLGEKHEGQFRSSAVPMFSFHLGCSVLPIPLLPCLWALTCYHPETQQEIQMNSKVIFVRLNALDVHVSLSLDCSSFVWNFSTFLAYPIG